MTSEAMSDELQALNLLVLSSQNTRLGVQRKLSLLPPVFRSPRISLAKKIWLNKNMQKYEGRK